MKFFAIVLAILPAILGAAAATTDDTPDNEVTSFIGVAHDTESKISFRGCHVRDCLKALAPDVAICAFAAAQEELDPINDVACFASAAKDIHHKPSACAHCY